MLDLPQHLAALQAQLPATAVWPLFLHLCALPRPSKQEEKVIEFVEHWAAQHGIGCQRDSAGNLLLSSPARPGGENRPSVVLQAHLDMVCQANPGPTGIAHDFLQMPLQPQLRDGWLQTPDTTLGADNGIGVALALAALIEPNLPRGPLEVLLTVDEEAGMGGAHGLAAGWLQSSLMLNLDTEQQGEFFLGCAGGCDVNISAAPARTPLPAGWQGLTVELAGLRGGHSGVDIHLGRGNANKLLAELLHTAGQGLDLRLSGWRGGTARNAIPRAASADIALPAAQVGAFEQAAQACLAKLRQRLAEVDTPPTLRIEPTAHCDNILSAAAHTAVLDALHTVPYGVATMSEAVPGVVETSNNLGVVTLDTGGFAANLMVRSLVDAASLQMAEQLAAHFAPPLFAARIDGHYPGWQPNPQSPLLAHCQAVHATLHGAPGAVRVIHAGLECGIIGAKYPGLDTVSFGPNIRGAHAPGERVEVASVDASWRLLRAILTTLPATL